MLREKLTNLRKDQVVTILLLVLLFVLLVTLGFIVFSDAFDELLESDVKVTPISELFNKDSNSKRSNARYSIDESKVNKKLTNLQKSFDKYIPGIVCWGDSLTDGSMCETSYPKILGETIQANITDKFDMHNYFDDRYSEIIDNNTYKLEPVDIVNLGVGGETSATIVGRNGAIDMVNAYEIVIPAECEPVELAIDFATGGFCQPIRMEDSGGVNPVTIEGVTGTLSIEQENAFDFECTYYFTRSEPGDETPVYSGAPIHSYAEDKYLDYWMIIFMGTNGGYNDVEDLVNQHKAMIDQQKNKNYIIIGMHYGEPEELEEIDAAMEEEFGRHYISLHEFFTTNDLSEYGYSLTPYDLELQEEGYAPASIMYEGLHFNEKGYTVISDLVYKRMIELGYFDDIARILQIELN